MGRSRVVTFFRASMSHLVALAVSYIRATLGATTSAAGHRLTRERRTASPTAASFKRVLWTNQAGGRHCAAPSAVTHSRTGAPQATRSTR